MTTNTENLKIWDAVEMTDPAMTKEFKRGGGFSGTAINPVGLAKRATEIFGPCGIGWGVEIADEKYQPGAPLISDGKIVGTEIIHILRVDFWYMLDGVRGVVTQFGQTTFVGGNKYGFFTDEEAPKKSMTDGMSKCLSLLGFSADVYMGLYDDSKYVTDAKKTYAEKSQANAAAEKEARKEALMTEARAVVAAVEAVPTGYTRANAANQAIDALAAKKWPASLVERTKKRLTEIVVAEKIVKPQDPVEMEQTAEDLALAIANGPLEDDFSFD